MVNRLMEIDKTDAHKAYLGIVIENRLTFVKTSANESLEDIQHNLGTDSKPPKVSIYRLNSSLD